MTSTMLLCKRCDNHYPVENTICNRCVSDLIELLGFANQDRNNALAEVERLKETILELQAKLDSAEEGLDAVYRQYVDTPLD